MIKFNEENEIISEEEIRTILVGVQMHEDITYSMEELERLADAASALVIGQIVQNMDKINNATFIGKGKVEELKLMVENMEADAVIFNDELTGVQIRNIEDIVGVRVITRTILILDIFAARATSKEGKLQVELAQLKYRLPRLVGFRKSLSRTGAGIGARGPGEKRLEIDRRHITKRMEDIKKEIDQIKATRSVQRKQREKSGIPIVALVGYTNAGKSAIMNTILEKYEKEDKMVKSQDMLFATLDVQQRNIALEKNKEFILIDTVGFVSKLPHSLIDAFKATLEEVLYADLIVHVVDTSFYNYNFQIEVTEEVLKDIGTDGIEKIYAYNKVDKVDRNEIITNSMEHIFISAKTGENIDKLLDIIKSKIFKDSIKAIFVVPFDKGDVTSYIMNKGTVIKLEYLEEGTKIEAELPLENYNRVKEYDTIQNN